MSAGFGHVSAGFSPRALKRVNISAVGKARSFEAHGLKPMLTCGEGKEF